MKIEKLKLIILNILKSTLSPIFGFITLSIGIKYFGEMFWGDFIYYYSWVLLLSFFPGFGHRDFLLRRFSEDPSQVSNVFSVNFWSRIPILIFTIALTFIIFPSLFISITILMIALYIYNSLASVIVYNQLFGKQLYSELFGFLGLISGLFFLDIYSVSNLLLVFAGSIFIKISFFYKELSSNLRTVHFEKEELKDGFLFFLIGISGLLVSKMDIYLINLMVPKSEIALYNMGMTGLTLLQTLAFLVILPFTKHIYRLPQSTIHKISNQLLRIGFLVCTLGVFSLWFFLNEVMNIKLEIQFYYYASFSIIPIYFYLMKVMSLYRNHREKELVVICFIGAVCNGIFSFFCIEKLGYTGGVLGFALSQWILLGLYKINEYYNRRISH